MVLNEESIHAHFSPIKVIDGQPCSVLASCSHSTTSFEACSDALDNDAKRIRKAPDRLGEWQYANYRNEQVIDSLISTINLSEFYSS